MMHSLRVRLLGWLLVPVAAFVLVTGVMTYDAARETAGLLQDNALLASARIIGEEVNWENGMLVARIPPAALEMFESPYQDQVFYRIVKGRAGLLGGNPELALSLRRQRRAQCFTTRRLMVGPFARSLTSGNYTTRAQLSRSRLLWARRRHRTGPCWKTCGVPS